MWQDHALSQQLSKEKVQLEQLLVQFNDIENQLNDVFDLYPLALEEDCEAEKAAIEADFFALIKKIKELIMMKKLYHKLIIYKND